MDKEEEYEYWARVIRETQRLSGMTLKELAGYLGVDQRSVKYWKSGKRRPMGLVALRLYEYRVELYRLGTVVHLQVRGTGIVS